MLATAVERVTLQAEKPSSEMIQRQFGVGFALKSWPDARVPSADVQHRSHIGPQGIKRGRINCAFCRSSGSLRPWQPGTSRAGCTSTDCRSLRTAETASRRTDPPRPTGPGNAKCHVQCGARLRLRKAVALAGSFSHPGQCYVRQHRCSVSTTCSVSLNLNPPCPASNISSSPSHC